ncbi:mucin-2-like [Rhopilema esculentum]|uniref:mucin-2-like n=1 Tax=Rhopilema esculentum TaxID=499914 RepID=UPI0031D3D3F3
MREITLGDLASAAAKVQRAIDRLQHVVKEHINEKQVTTRQLRAASKEISLVRFVFDFRAFEVPGEEEEDRIKLGAGGYETTLDFDAGSMGYIGAKGIGKQSEGKTKEEKSNIASMSSHSLKSTGASESTKMNMLPETKKHGHKVQTSDALLSEETKPTGQVRQEIGPNVDEIKNKVLINKAEKKEPVLLSHSLPLPLLLLDRPSSTNFLSKDANVSTTNGSEGKNQNESPIDTATDKSDIKTNTELIGDSSAAKLISKRDTDAVQQSSERNGSSENDRSNLVETPEINKVSAEVPAPIVLKETANKSNASNPADSSVTTLEEKLISEASSSNLSTETHTDAYHENQLSPNAQEAQETITVGVTSLSLPDVPVNSMAKEAQKERSGVSTSTETNKYASHEVPVSSDAQEGLGMVTVEVTSPSLPDVPVNAMAQETQEENHNASTSTETNIDVSHEVPVSSDAQEGLEMVTVEATSPSVPDIPVNPMAQETQEKSNDASTSTESNTDVSHEVPVSSDAQEGLEMVTVEATSPSLPDVPVNPMAQETQEESNDASTSTESNTDVSHEVPVSSDAQEGLEMVTVEVTSPSLPDVPVNPMAQETQEESNDASTSTESNTDVSHEVPVSSDAQEGLEMVTVEATSPSLPDVPVNPMAQETQEESNDASTSTESNTDVSHEVPVSSDAQEGLEMVTVEATSPSVPDIPVNPMAQETQEKSNDASTSTESNTDVSHEVPVSSDAQEGLEMVTVEATSPSLPDVPVNAMAQETQEESNDASTSTESNTDVSHEVPVSSDAQEGLEMVTVEVTSPSLPDVPVNPMAQETQEKSNDASTSTESNTDVSHEVPVSSDAQEGLEMVTVEATSPSLPDVPVNAMAQETQEESNDASTSTESNTDVSHEVPVSSDAQEGLEMVTVEVTSPSLPDVPVNPMAQETQEENHDASTSTKTNTDASHEVPVSSDAQEGLEMVTVEVRSLSLPDVPANPMAQETPEENHDASTSTKTNTDASHEVPVSSDAQEGLEMVTVEVRSPSLPDVPVNPMAQETQEKSNDASTSTESNTDVSHEVPVSSDAQEGLEMVTVEATSPSLPDVPVNAMAQETQEESNDASTSTESNTDVSHEVPVSSDAQEGLEMVTVEVTSPSLPDVPVNPMAQETQEENHDASTSTKTNTDASHEVPVSSDAQEGLEMVTVEVRSLSLPDVPANPMAQETPEENHDASTSTKTNTDASHEVPVSSDAQEGLEMVTVEVRSPSLPDVPVNTMAQETQEENHDASTSTETNTDASHEVPVSSDAQEGLKIVTVEVTSPSLPDVPVNPMAQETQEENHDASISTETNADVSHEISSSALAQEATIRVQNSLPSLSKDSHGAFFIEAETDAAHEVPFNPNAQESKATTTGKFASSSLLDTSFNQMTREVHEEENGASLPMKTDTDASFEVLANQSVQLALEKVASEVSLSSLLDASANPMAQKTEEKVDGAFLSLETDPGATDKVPSAKNKRESQEVVEKEITPFSLPDVAQEIKTYRNH